MIQFMKAMRDEKGEMVRNAHLLGFFRRICKLLYLRTKPVFVFDGGTPALKRRTVIARRRQRENAQAKIRKTAEKLLLNHLKTTRLKELAKDLENQRKNQKNDAKGKKILADQTHVEDDILENNDVESYDQEKLDEMLAASIAAEEDGNLNNNASTSAAADPAVVMEDDDENEEIILPAMYGHVDPAVLAALPISMQLDLLMRERSMSDNRNNQGVEKDTGNQSEDHKTNLRGKEVLLDHLTNMEGGSSERNDLEENYNQEKLDQMLAASIAAEEAERLTKSASTSAAAIPSEEESGDEDEEMILPALFGRVDPAVLAALPPSMQLDLLVQMRERLMAENRQRYQKVKKAPEKFSELQIEAYLKTVAFRREIDQVQKAASGKGVSGVQTSRIASEANREFIFSSSFTGDKQLLTSAGVYRNGNEQQQRSIGHSSSDSLAHVLSTSKSNTVTGLVPHESRQVIDEDVETYLDERGHIRVSRVRAMGMRMTRDLQRNLDLMKEIEHERTHANKNASAQSEVNRDNIGYPKRIPSKIQHVKSSNDNNGDSVKLNERNAESILNNKGLLEISFEVDGESKSLGSDDEIFTSLVAGKPVTISSVDNGTLRRESSDSVSDSDWEEGIIEVRGNNYELESNPPPKGSNIGSDSEVEWEEGVCDVENFSLPSESGKLASKGYLEEQADLQEAIRRSLEDFGDEKFNHALSEHEKQTCSEENAFSGVGFLDSEDNTCRPILLEKDANQQNKHSPEILTSAKLDSMDQIDVSHVFSSSGRQLKLSEVHDPDKMSILQIKSCVRDLGSNTAQSSQDASIGGNFCRGMRSAESVAPLKAKEAHMTVELSSDTLVQDVGLSTSSNISSAHGSHVCKPISGKGAQNILTDDLGNKMEEEISMLVNEEQKTDPLVHSAEIANSSMSSMEPSKDSAVGTDVEPNLAGDKNSDNQFNENCMDKFGRNENLQADFAEASLQEEIFILGQERINLGDEWKKLERNAESVNSEMFAECQELLQMFGLPYIIAPMEAEAQCAYMELANLVDGVVTDDSDVFLFGARNVYKNIFDDRKYVETYFMKDIEKELGLNREKLIRMALLLGSDYTEGISGIGIVNAIEVVNAFPEEDGLKKFREWIESPDPTILEKFVRQNGSSMRRKGSKVGDSDSNCATSNTGEVNSFGQNIPQVHEQEQSEDNTQEIQRIFMVNHRNVSKNWHIPSSFPSDAVLSAYSSPQVDKSTEPFTWGKPDIQVLRKLCWEKFGWGIQKSDELLLPVLKEYNKRETQLRMEAFYSFNERFAKIRSKRIKKALKGITGNQFSELMENAVEENSRSREKRTVMPDESGDCKTERPSKRAKGGIHNDKNNSLEKSATKRSRKSTVGEPVLSEVKNQGEQAEGRKSTHKGSHGGGRGKGRGRGCGRGRGRGRGKGDLGFEQSNSSSDDFTDGDDKLENHVQKSEESQGLRRSMRSRKPVSYSPDDLEIDIVDKQLDQDDKNSDKEAVEPDLFGVLEVCRDSSASLNDKEDLLPENSKDHLEMGGGFVTDEDGNGQAGVSNNSYPCEPDASKHYLEMGGGFCMDESETGTNQDAAHSPSMAAVGEIFESPYTSGLMKEADCPKGPVQSVSGDERTSNDVQDGQTTISFVIEPTKHGVDVTDTVDHSQANSSLAKTTGSETIGRLSAMPFLKRKRRKS
ncbi:DNA repair protein UVH3 isoform X2 [Jatropha curcas]|nr:DNA repair protein UVH3 isoform X2 [Jatropha curcas]